MKYAKKGLFLGSLPVIILAAVLLMGNWVMVGRAQTTPTVSISINGSSSVNLSAPANYTVTWSSSGATACSTSGSSGSQMGQANTATSGSQAVASQGAGNYTYTIICDGVSASATATVTAPTTSGYSGFCMVRNSNTSIPQTIPSADVGTGYAKVSKGSVTDISALRSACSDTDYAALLTSYCVSNTAQVQREVVLYDANNNFYSNGGASQGFSYLSCPSTAPATPSGLTATVSGSSVVLHWVDNSSNETGFKIYKTINSLWTDIGNVAANVTTFTDTSVTSGTSYTYRLQSFTQSSGSSPVYSALSLTATVIAGSTSSGGGGSGNTVTVDVKINGSDSAQSVTAPASYTVTWTSANAVNCVSTGTWGTSDKGLTGSQSFTGVTVVGTNTYGIMCTGTGGAYGSDSVQVIISSGSTSTTTPPSAPSNLLASAITGGVALSWTDNSTNETGFKLYRYNTGGWTDIGNVSANTTSYLDTNISAGTSYSYRLQSFIQTTGSSYPVYSTVSNTASVTTSGSQTNTTTTTASLLGACVLRDSYTGLPMFSAVDVGNGYAKTAKLGNSSISSLQSSCSTTDYQNLQQAYCATNKNPYQQQVATFNSTGSPLSTSCGQFGCSYISCPTTSQNQNSTTTTTSQTTVATSTPPTAPANLTAVSGNYNITLSWTDTSNNETGFKIYKTIGSLWTDIGNVSANTTSYVDTSVVSGSSYSYKVQAFYQASGAYPLYSSVSNVAVAQFVQANSSKIVTGKITFSDGSPVTDALVGVYITTAQKWLNVPTDAQGNFSLGLSGGDYTVGIIPKNQTTAAWSYSGNIGNVSFKNDLSSETQTINYTLTKDITTLTVLATDANKQPLANVYISPQGANSVPGQKTNAQGQVVLSLPRGIYNIQAYIGSAVNYVNPPQQSITVTKTENQSLTFVFSQASAANLVSLSGTAKLEDGSVANAYVWAWSEDGQSVSQQTVSNGSFVFKVSPNSVWHLGADKQISGTGYRSAEVVVNVGTGDTQTQLTLSKLATPLPQAAAVTAPVGGTITAQTTDGAQVTLPPNSVVGATGNPTLQILPTVEAPVQPSKIPVSTVYDITLKDNSGNKISSFNSLVEVRIPYDPNNISALGLDQKNLKPSYYDDSSGTWIEITNYTLDTQNHMVIAKVNHLTRFAIVMPADATPPAAPTGMQAAALSAGGIALSWTNPTQDFKFIRVYRSQSADVFGQLIKNDITTASFTDAQTTAGATYYYVVRAVDPAGNESTNTQPVFAQASGSQISQNTAPAVQLARDLKQNMRGNDVKILQQFLISQGLLKAKATAFFGPATKQAVIKFQQKYAQELLGGKPKKANGIVSGLTRQKISNLLLAVS